MNPRVSIILSVYNGEEYIKEAIESILHQTFANIELIVINDGSTDDTTKILNNFNDLRIVRIVNDKNLGLVASLNKGLRAAKGEFVARMDGDDISLPNRIEKQVKYLEQHPDIGVLGAAMEQIDASGKTLSYFKPSVYHDDIVRKMLTGTAVAHATVMIRREQLLDVGGYNENFPHVEDTELWSRLVFHTKFANLPDVLYKRRIHNNSIMSVYFKLQTKQSEIIREKLLVRFLEKNIITISEAQKIRAKKNKNNILINILRLILPVPFRHKINSRLHSFLSYFAGR